MSDVGDDDYPDDDYVDDDDDGDAYGASLSASQAEDEHDDRTTTLKRTASFTVLSQQEIEAESKRLTTEVSDVLCIPSTAVVAALLRHYQWQKDRLVEAFMEDSDKVCAAAGMPSLGIDPPTIPKGEVTCLVCFDTVPSEETSALACGHRYCADCWKTYLEVKVKEGATCTLTRCMYPKCKELVHDAAFRRLCSPATFDRYNMFLLRSFVDDNPQCKWCPAPGCGRCMRCDRRNRKEPVACACGFKYCFACSDFAVGDHMPATCENVEKWNQKATDESENVTWMMANTKRCPKCRSPIEKNGGCMHMTCAKGGGGCGHEFCWMCRGPWSEHGSATGGYYSCNKYDASEAKKDDSTADMAKSELELYMFYYHRFDSHKNALKIADDQRQKAEVKGSGLQTLFEIPSADTKFLLEATEQLLASRRVLQWSYVYGYYLEKSKEKNLFEFLQENLEKHTNELSTAYELPVEKLTGYAEFTQWKMSVTNATRVTAKFQAHFVEGVNNGLTEPK